MIDLALDSASYVAQAKFADLWIGEDFCDVKGLDGAETPRVPVPVEWNCEIEIIRQRCKHMLAEHGDPEFSISIANVIFRVTQMTDYTVNGDVFFLRKSSADIRAIERIGLPLHVINTWRDPELRGLVIISGEMGHGKTSSAAGFVVDRLKMHGGLCIAIEDPNETPLSGVHGSGRCIQVHASRKRGGYREQLTRALRTGADLIFLGEIRDTATAVEAINASINGHLILATEHAGGPVQSIERLISLASPEMPNAHEIIATGISMVITQTKVQKPNGVRLSFQPLVFHGSQYISLRHKIRSNNIQTLSQDVQLQGDSANWGNL